MKRITFFVGLLMLMSIPQRAITQSLDSLVLHALKFAGQQLRQSVAEINDSTKFARSTLPDGSWKTSGAREWTSGFFAGCLWNLDEYTKDPFFKQAAERWTAGVAEQQFNAGTHDVGFMIFNSFGNGNRLYPSDSYKKVILQAAQTLATRFNPTVGCIKSWDNPKWAYPVIIDNMMNLELLFWSADHGGPKRLRDIAIRHAETTMKNHFRQDGATYHVLGYDTANGSVAVRNTHQGYADESVWARGQAWAIYGFTMTYRFTKDDRFLKTAQRAADYFIGHLPSDHIPYWDFMAPDIPNEPRDVSAATITASALFELSEYTKGNLQQANYRDVAEKILRSLCSAPYLAERTNSHAILNHAVGSKPAKSEVDVSIIYADYYFIEAMLRYLRSQEKQVIVRVKNALKIDRPREVVSVRWRDVKAKLPSLDLGGSSIREKASTNDLIYQIVDHNQDGTTDELVFQSSFKAGETKEFVVRQLTEKKQPLQSLTDARFVTPRADIAWENDRIAYRMYGPALTKESNNGIDIWTKRVRYLIVEKWYKGEEQTPKISYHEDHGEGADYFTVGRSLGAGACALLKGDSLYQPGVFTTYKIIATGPLQAIFELTYNPVVYEGKKITEVVRITLNAGVNLNKIDVTFSSESSKGKVTFASGIVKRKGTTTYSNKNAGWIGLWGLTTDKEEIGYLGTGIVMPKATMKEMKEDNVHALIVGQAELGKVFTYYAGAGWTRSGDFASAKDWNLYLTEFAQRVRASLVVSFVTR